MTTLNDSHLAYLLGLGFELELCKQALTVNTTLEDATEWILDPNRPPVKKLTLELPQPQELDLTKPVASSSTLSGSTIKPIDPDKEKKEKQIQQKQLERIQQNLKKEKLLEREARKRALLEIQQDKEKRKQKVQATSLPISTPSPQPSPQTAEEKGAFIQFKFTNSSTLRQKFPTNTTVNDLLDFVYNKELAWNPSVVKENIQLVNVYPRRVYTHQDASLDMKSAGFLPNVSLNVSTPVPEVEQDVQMTESTNEEAEQDQDVEMSQAEHEEEEEDIDEEQREDAHDEENDQQMEEARSAWRRFGTGHQLSDPTPMTEVIPEEGNEEQDANTRRFAVLSALEQRSRNSNLTNDNPTQPTGVERHTTPLHEICSKSVAVLLTQHTTKATEYLKQLSNISSDVAESLLKQLIKNGKLNVSTLRKLTNHCYVQNVILDSYVYCTDSLIEDLARSNSSISITKLSLRGCDVITDNGIRALAGLKNLSYLDVNNCKLTDKGLKPLESLNYLNYLNLSKTKITDKGVASMVSNANFKDQLEVLLLDGCSRIKSSNTLVPIVNAFTQLVQLSLANTAIQKQDINTKLRKPVRLEQLDLSNTFITDEDIVQIVSQFHQLIDLKLGRCEELTTRGLSFLPRELRYLKYIQFPNREHELDGVLSRFKDLPLMSLDLTGFLNVTDEGAKHIAHMKQLRYLNLDGTKITDEGIVLLEDLIELEKLYLDRISLTDVGLEKLTGLSKLDTLSLCHTQVSNAGLKILGDFERTSFARGLRTLNLAQCTLITNKGVKYLSGMFNLTNLNLDHTSVSKTCLKYLKDLKYLKPVRLQGIEDEEDQDDEDDDDA